jgi:5'-3' exonuclease
VRTAADPITTRPVRVHLVDATYELFRAYHAPRPPVRGRDGMPLTAVAGLVGTLLALLRDEGATHVACAHDRVIRSFRNDLWPGYKTEAGVPADLLAQFPVAEEAIVALGLPLWAMVELEADDALATAAARFAADPDVTQVLVCTPDKDLAQVVRGDRVVLRDRRRDLVYDDAGVRAKWGVAPGAIPDWLALVGDAADGFPGLPGFGAVAASTLLAAFDSLEGVRAAPPTSWPARIRGAERLAATLDERWADAILFRDLATLRLDAPLPERAAEELRWGGTDRAAWAAFCARWELPGLLRRPHRWHAA